MRKLIIRIPVLLLLLYIPLYLYDSLASKYTNYDLFQLPHEFSLLKDAKYVSFGSSITKRLKWGYPGPKNEMATFSMNGDDLFLIYEKMNLIKGDLAGKTVMIGLAYNSFNYAYDTIGQEMTENMRQFYYKMPLKYVKFGNALKVFKSKFYVVNNMNIFNKIIKKEPPTKNDYKEKVYKSIDADSSATKQYKSIVRLERKMPGLTDSIKDVIIKIKTMAAANHFKIVFYFTSVYHHYFEHFPEKEADSFHQLITGFLKDQKLPFYDYQKDAAYMYNYDYFNDDLHMSRRGAALIVKRLFDDMARDTKPMVN